jgi:hypothetical protein
MKKGFETVTMWGKSLSQPDKTVEIEVAVADINAFKASGFELGALPDEYKTTAVEAEEAHKTGNTRRPRGRR